MEEGKAMGSVESRGGENGDGEVGDDLHVIPRESAPSGEEITPLLIEIETKPRMNIFSVSYPRARANEVTIKQADVDIVVLGQCISWIWSGSKYSGLLCMALASSTYFFMEVLVDIFSVGSVSLFQVVFTRCTISLILSFLWLRKMGQPVFGPTHIRRLLSARALFGYLSLVGFIYSIQHLVISSSVVLNFLSPLVASIVARISLKEKLKLTEIGGLICSFLGLLFIFRPMQPMPGMTEGNEMKDMHLTSGSHQIYDLFVGLLSSVTCGISYCLIRAAAKASDQPVLTTFAFGMLSSPATAIIVFTSKDFVLPTLLSFFLMALLGVLSFFAEILLARGLQLEKTSKVMNVLFLEVLLMQIWGIGLLRLTPSFHRLVGCLLLVVSLLSTIYLGPDEEMKLNDAGASSLGVYP